MLLLSHTEYLQGISTSQCWQAHVQGYLWCFEPFVFLYKRQDYQHTVLIARADSAIAVASRRLRLVLSSISTRGAAVLNPGYSDYHANRLSPTSPPSDSGNCDVGTAFVTSISTRQ